MPFSSSYNVPLILLVLAGFWITLSRFKELKTNPRIRVFIVLFLCIFIPMLVSAIDAIEPEESIRKVLSFVLYVFFAITIIRYAFNCESSKGYFINATGILLLLWTLDAMWQYIYGSDILGFPYEHGRLSGIFYPSFKIGIVMAILSPFYFEFIRKINQQFIVSWILIVPFILVILLSGSRTSWFMLFISILFYGAYSLRSGFYRGVRWQSVLSGLMVLSILFIAINIAKPEVITSFSSQVGSRIDNISIDTDKIDGINALELRVRIWERGLRIFSNHWVNGVGVRGFRYVDKETELAAKSPILSKIASNSTHPHQITLEILVETGVIGLIGFMVFYLVLIRVYLRAWKDSSYQDNLFWCIPVFIATFPLNMHKSFYGHFSSVIIWVLVAIAIANMSILNTFNRKPQSDP